VKYKTILIVDDNMTNLDILIELLDATYDLIPAIDGEFALEVANDDKPDLILLDIMMPVMDGFEVCKKLKENENTKDIPIIFITSDANEDSIEKAYKIGGTDYVTKPFRPRELLSRVEKELKLQDMMKELKLLASTDPMTKLYNRRYFINISESLLDLAKRNKSETSIIMLDIDRFKNINDTYGHKVGDNVIINLASSLQKLIRKSDVICRWGGEEFIILLADTKVDNTLIIAEKIRIEIENSVISLDNNKELKFTASMGVSMIDTENDVNIDDSINRADKALYEAKEDGRNKVVLFI